MREFLISLITHILGSEANVDVILALRNVKRAWDQSTILEYAEPEDIKEAFDTGDEDEINDITKTAKASGTTKSSTSSSSTMPGAASGSPSPAPTATSNPHHRNRSSQSPQVSGIIEQVRLSHLLERTHGRR